MSPEGLVVLLLAGWLLIVGVTSGAFKRIGAAATGNLTVVS
jgi:hypothetical protein